MQTLELECPACGELLELDMGFAGGVCRCSACGTLMTVPQDAVQGAQPEQLSRPDRPDDPSGMSGVMESSAPAAPRPRERASSSRRSGGRAGKGKGRGKGKAKGRPGGRASSRSGERIEQGVYTTASGKTIKIDRAMDVPTAQTRRTGVRIATAVVFFSIVGVVVLLGAVAVVWMLQNPKGGNPEQEEAERIAAIEDPTQFVFNASTNPYTHDQPNAVGLPISGVVAIVFDVDPANEEWLAYMAEMVGIGLHKPGSEAVVLVYAAGPEGVRAFRNEPVVAATVSPGQLASFLADDGGAGATGVEGGIIRAVQAEATMIILVTGQPASADIDAWAEELEAHGDITVHGVLVYGFSNPFKRWVSGRSGGEFINLSRSQLLDWRDEAGLPVEE